MCTYYFSSRTTIKQRLRETNVWLIFLLSVISFRADLQSQTVSCTPMYEGVVQVGLPLQTALQLQLSSWRHVRWADHLIVDAFVATC